MKLAAYLKEKPLFYKKIDYERMPKAYALIKDAIKLPKIIHIVGTNGKGTTGRFLASLLKGARYKVGHYTSPHILQFNERIWIDGKDIDNERLEYLHERLQKLLPKDVAKSLSYFEYTTFLAILAFEDLDFAVLEAGLGGEHDATAVFENILTLVTSIDYDHQAFLGDTIEKIATTKLKAIKKAAIVGYQKHSEVEKIAKKFGAVSVEEYIPSKGIHHLEEEVSKRGFPPFFAQNLALAIAAMQYLALRWHLEDAFSHPLKGRMQRCGNILLDVGHNPLSAKAIAPLLEKDTVLVYNTYADKEYETILRILRPRIERVEILPVQNERIVARDELEKSLRKLGIIYKTFERIHPDEKYLVYGSFSVVEEFMKKYGC